MATLRPYRPGDLDALYRICLLTGAAGKDASLIYEDPELLGHIYAGPYGVIEPEHIIVVEDDEGVAGYVVGTYDSRQFEQRLEGEWWPALRSRYLGAEGVKLSDQRLIGAIMQPWTADEAFVGPYPAHIHMNLLPRLRGQRIGSQLLNQWVEAARAAGVRGIHLGAGKSNDGGIAFWSKYFERLREDEGAVWFGMTL